MRTLAVLANLVGLLPLAVCAIRRPPAAWWWLAVAFGVSFAADVAGAFGYARLVSQTYPVAQAAIVALVLLPRPYAVAWIATLFAVSGASLALRQGAGLDVWVHLAAWLVIPAMAYHVLRPCILRRTLIAGFWGLAVTWCWYVAAPGWASWGALQTVRLATAAGFGIAVWREARA